MLRSRIALLAAALLLASCSDPEKEANTLFVEAAGLVQRASSEGPVAKLATLGQAKAKIAEIVGERYASTAAAMKVASGERLGGMNQGEIEAAISAARLTPEVCALERTRACTVAAAVRGAKAGAASTDPEANHASWLTLAMLQSTDGAPGVDEVKAAIGASRWFKERNTDIDVAANDAVARSLDTVARRDGLAAAVDRLNLLIRSTTGDDQRWLRFAGWETLSREIDLARDADVVVDEIAMLSDEDRARIASSVVPGYISSREEADRVYGGAMKLVGYLEPARRTTVLESFARHGSRERLMDVVDMAPEDAAKAKLVYTHLSGNGGDMAPAEFLSLYRILPPAERRMLRRSLAYMAVDPKVDPATAELLLVSAEADVRMDAKDTDTRFPVLVEAARAVRGPDPDGDVAALVRRLVSGGGGRPETVANCGAVASLLASAGRKQDLGMMSEACLPEYRDAKEDARSYVVFAAGGLSSLAALGDDASFERWFETIRDEVYVPSASSYILNPLRSPERIDLRERIAERFPSGAEMVLGNVRTDRLLQAVKADAPDVLERWDELFATDTPWRFEFMPEKPGGWTEDGRKLFARLVKDRPDDLRALYRGEVQSSRLAVPGLEPSQALAVLDFPKSEVIRTRLLTQIVTQRGGKLTEEERAAAWRVGPDEAQNGLRMATLLAWRADEVPPATPAAQAAPAN